SANLQQASYGGLVTWWGTPTGCALQNSVATADRSNSAYHYMKYVYDNDSRSAKPTSAGGPGLCRQNYVLLVTDGAANGPGDIDPYTGASACNSAACNATTNPSLIGCTCRSVLAA